MIYVLSARGFANCEYLGRKLRWKQVRILRGPATVLTELCLYMPLNISYLGRRDEVSMSKSGDMHRLTICCVGRTQTN